MTIAIAPAGGRAAWQGQGGHTPVMLNGNTAWAQGYAMEIRALIKRQSDRAPRTLQTHLGPSELGEECHRQVIWKMIAEPKTNHVSDPWPSIIGTATHAWLAQALNDENQRLGMERYLAELRVTPMPGHSGTTDAYDKVMQLVGDWKVLGPSSMAKVMSPSGPPRRYKVQLLLYWLGILRMGYPAVRIALIALPRTAPSLDGMYVWGHEPGPADVTLLQEVLQVTAAREAVATEIMKGNLRKEDIPATPSSDSCFFCPFYRPQSANGGPGCPGGVAAVRLSPSAVVPYKSASPRPSI